MERNAFIHFPKTSPENIFIKQIWRSNDSVPKRRTETVLPKGTVEIIFNLLDDVYYYRKAEGAVQLPTYFINGLNFTPIQLNVQKRQYFIGIQFNVFTLRYIFDIPAAEFNDRVYEGSLVCKSLDTLADKLSCSQNFGEQVESITQWFKSKMKNFQMEETKNRIISLHSDPDITNLSVNEISDKYNITPRHLSRLCVEYLGMCPEEFILYNKYLSSLNLIHQQKQSLTNISYDCNFYDQSHFVRTFKSFTGLTPSQYRKSAGVLPGHLFQNDEEDLSVRASKEEFTIIAT